MKSTLQHIEDAFARDKAFDKTRTEANLELLNLLGDYIMNHPTQRFGQILRNLGVIREIRSGFAPDSMPPQWVNDFNTESTEILRRVRASIQEALDAAEKDG